MKKGLFLVALLGLLALVGCGKKDEKTSGTTTVAPTTTENTPTVDTRPYYNFIIYEKDSDNTNLSDNKVVASYLVRYSTATNVADSLIKKGNKYYFVEDGTDYLILEDSAWGLTYVKGYFENYSECANNKEIEVDWSMTTGNGVSLMTGIGTTPLEGLNQYGFVIDGWR